MKRNTVYIKLSAPPPLAKILRKKGGGDLVRDRRPPRKIAKHPRNLQPFLQNLQKLNENPVINRVYFTPVTFMQPLAFSKKVPVTEKKCP